MPRKTELAPERIGVKGVPTSELMANPHNPRLLFDKAPLDVLRESIRKVGILVPLTVYWDSRRERFIILDGQRRWIVAQSLGLTEVPVNQVAEPTLVQNIVTMFQIHKLREDWELMPTALKLEVLMSELKERNEAKLAALTGLDKAVVSRCKKLLTYDRRFQDLMLDPDPEKRVKADFFIELYVVRTDRFVNSFAWFDKDEFTDQMLRKYNARAGIKSVTDFRTVKQHINNARKTGHDKEIEEKFRTFIFTEDAPLSVLLVADADVSMNARRVTATVQSLEQSVRSLDPQTFYGEEELWSSLEKLYTAIRIKLTAAGRRINE